MRNRPAWRWIAGGVALLGLTVVAEPAPSVVVPGTPETTDVLGQVEVRERQAALSDGRTTSDSAAASGLFSFPAPTPATEVAAGPGIAQSVALMLRGGEAMQLISYPWRDTLEQWRVVFVPGGPGLRGLTLTESQRIEVYVRDTDTTWDLARVVAHELGHAVDLTLNDSADRQRWSDHRRLPNQAPWWPEAGLADFATGAGDFAECFAAWQIGSATLSRVGQECTAEDLELMRALTTG